MTPINIDDADQVCDLLEQAIKVNSQLKYKEKGFVIARSSKSIRFNCLRLFCVAEVDSFMMSSSKMIGAKWCWNSIWKLLPFKAKSWVSNANVRKVVPGITNVAVKILSDSWHVSYLICKHLSENEWWLKQISLLTVLSYGKFWCFSFSWSTSMHVRWKVHLVFLHHHFSSPVLLELFMKFFSLSFFPHKFN